MTRRNQALCSCCRTVPPVNGQAYCAFCRNWINRKHRKRYTDLNPVERKKADARTNAGQAQRRGNLIPQPCEVAGCGCKAEKHHPDYDRPFDVRWLCQRHHREEHRKGPAEGVTGPSRSRATVETAAR